MLITVIFGSNRGNRKELIEKAIEKLSVASGNIISESAFYETEPWGFKSQDLFLNKAVAFESNLAPLIFLETCLSIEKQLGRTRPIGDRYTSRTIDIDMIFYGTKTIKHPDLQIPHPRIAERRFVLIPLNEIMPDFVHPAFHQKISDLLVQCSDKMDVKKWNPCVT